MVRCRSWWLPAAIGVLALVLVSPAQAQEYRGNLFVEVVSEGQPLAGATLTLQGKDFERSQTADGEGRARFTKLEPGTYTLTASAPGYGTLVMEAIEINTFANVNLPVTLTKVATLEERVVVTAMTPVLDQRKTGTSTVLTQNELSQVPTSRDPWSVLSTVPGITTDRVNVAGNEAGQQANFVGKGDDGGNTTWVMDGVEFTDVGAIGSSSTYFDFNSFEEIGFITGGADSDQPNGGARINFTTKQGTNDVSGNLRLWYTTNGLQSDLPDIQQPENVDPEANPLPGNEINEVFEKNFNLGGPILKDRIWYWFGFSQNDVDNQVAGTSDKTKLKNTTAKIHGQLGYKFNWKLFYTNGNKIKDGRGAAVTRPIETTWNQSGPTPIYTAYGSYMASPNFELSAQWGHVDGKFSLVPKGGLDAQIINDVNNVWSGSYLLYDTLRPQDQFVVRGNNYLSTGDWEHEIKYGYRYKSSTVESLSKWSNLDFFVYSGAYLYMYRERNFTIDLTHHNAWVGDTMTKGNWAINAGLSWTKQSGQNNPSTVPGVGICPECFPGLDYAGSGSVFTWDDITPRVGATYTFDTERRLLVRANYAQYVDQLGSFDVQYDNPLAGYLYITQYYTDLDSNGQVDEGEFSTDCEDGWGSVNPCDPNFFANYIDPDFKSPQTDELIAGVEWELMQDFTIGANLIMRDRDRERWYEGNLDYLPVAAHGPYYDVNEYELSGNLVPLASTDYDCTTMITGEFPDGTPYSEPACDFNESGLGKTDTVSTFMTNRPGYKTEYRGIEVTATKRLRDKWTLRGYFDYGEWTQKFSGTAGISDPTNFQGGTTQPDGDVSVPSTGSGTKDGVWLGTSRWQINVNGLYQLPRNFTISGNIYAREGYGIPYIDRVGGLASGSKDIQIGKIGDRRYKDLWTVDLAVGKTVKLASGTLELRAEIFNLFDADTVLSRKVRVDQPTNVNAITEHLSPRIIRFGASFNF